jgi:DNA-binding transcriptional LysR family regulator
MDIDTLRAFVAVADEQSFSRAASRLHLTQPAVSKRISALEQDLDSRLFDRVGRRVTLTESGRKLLPRARALLLEISDIRRQILNLSGAVSGRLSMGTSHHIGLHRLPPALRTFSQAHPRVELDIRFMDSEICCSAVLKGELEVGIVTLPLEPPDELRLQVLWVDPLETVVGKTHPLAGAPRIDMPHLLDHRAVLPGPDTFTRELLHNALGTMSDRLTVGMSTNYLETLKMLATAGLGWTLLPRVMLDDSLVPLEIKGLGLQRALGIATHRDRTLSNAARAMVAACEAVASRAR